MNYLLVSLAALGSALLTLLSGFGLGTLLLPAFLLTLHSVPVAVAATALVHLANNLFKLGLVGRHAVGAIVLRFGVPALLASVAGALLLARAAAWPELGRYLLAGHEFVVRPLNLVVGLLMVGFALFEWSPRLSGLAFPARVLPLGGVLSGFVGGLSGHQGALRAAFLARCGLGKEQYVGTGAVCAVLVDVARLAVYGVTAWRDHFARLGEAGGRGLVAAGVAGAFIGSYLGARLLTKTTLPAVQRLVACMLVALGLALAAGLV